MEDTKDLIKNEDVPIKTYYGTSPGAGNLEASYQQNIMRGDVPSQPPPKDYLIMSILVTIFCCLPFGVVGIVKSTMVKTLYQTGYYEEAGKTSQSAFKWSRTGLIIGVVFWTCYVIFLIVMITSL